MFINVITMVLILISIEYLFIIYMYICLYIVIYYQGFHDYSLIFLETFIVFMILSYCIML